MRTIKTRKRKLLIERFFLFDETESGQKTQKLCDGKIFGRRKKKLRNSEIG